MNFQAELKNATADNCKICHSTETKEDPFKRPCKCRGSMSFIHMSCLNECLKISKDCGICGHKFSFVKVYHEDMPGSLPLRCVVKAVCTFLLNLLHNALCLLYCGTRAYVIFKVNNNAVLRCIPESKEYTPILPIFLSLLLILLNYFYLNFFATISKMLNGISRIRINPRQALHELASDVILHTEARSQTSNHAGSRLAASIRNSVIELEDSLANDEEDIDEASSTISIPISYIQFNLFKDPLHLPTSLAILKADFEAVLSFTWGSFVIFGLYTFLNAMFNSLGTFGWLRPNSTVYSILIGCSLVKPLFISCSVIILTVLCCLFINFLTRKIHSSSLITMFYCTKLALAYPMDIYFSSFLVGVFTHLCIALIINRGTSVYSTSNSLLSTFIHMTVGVVVSRLTHTFKRKIISYFRNGLLTSYHYLEHHRPLDAVRSMIEVKWSFIFTKFTANLMFTSLVVLTGTLISSMFMPTIVITDVRSKCFAMKLLALSYVTTEELGTFLSFICFYITLFVSRLFSAQNYVFNEPVQIDDKNRLVWDANVNTEMPMLKSRAVAINARLSRYKNEEFRSSQPSTSIIEESQASEGTMSSLIDEDLMPSVKKSRKHRRIDEDEKKFLRKYAVSDKKVEKYYCKTHKGKFSLFYYPKYYSLFLLVNFTACTTVLAVFFYILFFLSHLSSKLILPRNAFVFSLAFITISRSIAMITSNRPKNFLSVIKQLILLLFTNILWPAMATVLYVHFYYDSHLLIRFSDLFLLFHSISFIPHFLVTRTGSIKFPDEYTIFLLVNRLISFTVVTASVASSVRAFKSYLNLPFLLWCGSSAFIAYHALLFLAEILSGSLFDKIRDKYYLKEITVADYVECSS